MNLNRYMSSKSNSVFHFTSTIESLFKILENNFYAFYNTEPIDDLFQVNNGNTNTFPLVSFCDIPLTRVEEHVLKYGKYAIGLSQNWALNNGLVPVFYYDNKMPIFEQYKSIDSLINRFENQQHSMFSSENNRQNDIDQMKKLLTTQKCYMKPLKSKIIGKNGKEETRLFHIENEWRYVPLNDLSKNDNIPIFIDSMNKTERNYEIMSKIIDGYKLKFSISDIDYIVVDNIKDISALISKIRSWNRKYAPETVDFLLTKIISLHQIKGDF